jgi:hypothetical protein
MLKGRIASVRSGRSRGHRGRRVMSVKLVNIGLIDDETIMVELSDQSCAAFSVTELLVLQRAKKTSESLEPKNLPN